MLVIPDMLLSMNMKAQSRNNNVPRRGLLSKKFKLSSKKYADIMFGIDKSFEEYAVHIVDMPHHNSCRCRGYSFLWLHYLINNCFTRKRTGFFKPPRYTLCNNLFRMFFLPSYKLKHFGSFLYSLLRPVNLATAT